MMITLPVAVLRIGHRQVRDDRMTTHAALVSRAFGCQKIIMTEVDKEIKKTIESINQRWGGDFTIEITDDWKAVIRNWKKNGGKIIHLTMYGVGINSFIEMLANENNTKDGCPGYLVVIGAEKVPREVYEMADYNVAVGNQPHSEIAALAVLLDRIFQGNQFEKKFQGGMIKIIPSEKGKKVVEKQQEQHSASSPH